MGKINKENLASLIKVGIIGLGLLFGVFFVFFAIPLSVIKNEKILGIYILSAVSVILILLFLLIFYYSYIAYKNNKQKYIDGKYVWDDGRVYEGDWDKKYGANGKGKLTWADGSYYEGEFKNGNLSGRGKKVCPTGESYEGYWKSNKPNGKGKLVKDGNIFEGIRVNGCLEGKGKLIGKDGGFYEGEFKKNKPDGMGIIKMKNGYYYEGEFSDGKRTGRFKKQVLTTGGVIEGEFRDNGSDGFDGIGKVSTSNGFVFEGTFKNGELSGEGKTITPNGEVLIGVFDKGKLKTGKKILKNGEYSEGNRDNGHLIGIARYYFKDGSYYEGEYRRGWQGTGAYITKNGDKYQTEFPYEIINFFMCGLNSKMKEIQGNLNYIPKNEKEKKEERDKYLEISEKGTSIQKEIAKIFLDFYEEGDKSLEKIRQNRGTNNYVSIFSDMNNYNRSVKNECKKLSDKHHIKPSSKGLYSYGKFFSKLDLFFDGEIKLGDLLVKIYKFLDSECMLDFIVKKDKKEKEWVGLIDNFSKVYRENVQLGLDWSEYESKFWEYNFKSDKGKK